MARKRDASQIEDFLVRRVHELTQRNDARQWWPRYLFHYSDLRNVVGVLQSGVLLGRAQAEARGLLVVSSGSTRVLSQTDDQVKDHVRLYFRPLTPTQYYAEGIRSKASLATSSYPDAHCPVPVFLLFGSREVLTRSDCSFSDRGLNRPDARVFSSAAELQGLPWDRIYHTGPYPSQDPLQADIPFRRNAEVIVPGELDLSALKRIWCRSVAEKDTLLHLLDSSTRALHGERIVASAHRQLFFCQHTFVQSVNLTRTGASFEFSPETRSPGPFDMLVELCHGEITESSVHTGQAHRKLQVRFRRALDRYVIRLKLDEHLAYANEFVSEEEQEPF